MVDLASAPRKFWINAHHGAGEVMVGAHGDLDLSNVPRLEGALRRVSETDGYRDIVVDLAAHRAWVGERELDLRAKEFDLLARLAADAGKMVTREALMADVWDENWVGSTKTLDVQLAALRRKLGEAPGTPSRITSIRSLGFRLEAR